MKVLAFDIWGDYGHFRKFYTTSSPLSFSFPPYSTCSGILGAIIGASKDEQKDDYYLKIFSPDVCKIAVKIKNSTKKVRMGINLINTKGNYWIPYSKKNHAPRTQIRTEFLKDPLFRIYFAHEDNVILETTAQLIKDHKCIYSISLGLSELLADFKYIGIYDAEEISDGNIIEISMPITMNNLIKDGLVIETGKKYFKEKMPIVMTSERIIEKYDNIIYEPDGKSIKAKLKYYYKMENGENIAFF